MRERTCANPTTSPPSHPVLTLHPSQSALTWGRLVGGCRDVAAQLVALLGQLVGDCHVQVAGVALCSAPTQRRKDFRQGEVHAGCYTRVIAFWPHAFVHPGMRARTYGKAVQV